MAKLTYWVAESDDSFAYSVRASTKKEVIALLEKRGCGPDGKRLKWEPWMGDYSKPHKVEVYYKDALDLLTRCLSEGRIYEGEL